VGWVPIEHNDSNTQHPDWYPFRLSALARERYVGLVCSARNDRNYAPLTQLPGKTVSVSCRDPQSEHLKMRRALRFQSRDSVPTVVISRIWLLRQTSARKKDAPRVDPPRLRLT
jgi:hypothetical protein